MRYGARLETTHVAHNGIDVSEIPNAFPTDSRVARAMPKDQPNILTLCRLAVELETVCRSPQDNARIVLGALNGTIRSSAPRTDASPPAS